MGGIRGTLAAALAVVAIVAAGCGGGGTDEPDRYAVQPTRACLQNAAAEVSTTNLDFVASTALGGALRVRLPTNFVVVAFGEDPDEAERIERAYRRFAGETIAIDDVLERTKNVVFVWNAPPSPEERAAVVGCLGAAE
jgi:hypothetical protein